MIQANLTPTSDGEYTVIFNPRALRHLGFDPADEPKIVTCDMLPDDRMPPILIKNAQTPQEA